MPRNEFERTLWNLRHCDNEQLDKQAKFLKLVSPIFYQIFIFLSNDRPSKAMKNAFYFI